MQVDAPEDSAMYIHRVGRTARNQAAGHALLMLLPSEERPVTEQLAQSGVPVKRIAVNPKHRVSVSSHAAALLVSQPDTRSLAKKAFTSYLRSIQLLPFNSALDIRSLALDAFSASLGLAVTPELPVIERGEAGRELNRDRKNVNRSLDKLKRQIKEAKEAKRRAKEEATGLIKRPTGQPTDSDSEGSDDDLLVPKGGPATDDGDQEPDHDSSEVPVVPLSRKKLAKLRIRTDDASKSMRLAGSKRTVFDEAGEEVAPLSMHLGARPALDAEQVTKHARQVKARLDASRAEDDAEEQRRVRDLHRARRMRDRPEKDGADEGVQLGGDDEGDNGHNYEDQDSDDNGSESESEQEEVIERSKKVTISSSNKRKQVYTSDSEDDEKGHNSDPSGADLARQEQRALELLGRR